MTDLPLSIPIVVALLTVFLSFVVGLGYTMENNSFRRTRFMMTAFFVFIVCTLTISFSQYTLATLPFTVPAMGLGIAIGYVLGVRTERQKLAMQGLAHYMDHFAHIHIEDFTRLTWWSFINFYSVMGALLLINLVGFTNVIYEGAEELAILTSVFGAFLIGSITPYLIHLWTISMRHHRRSTTSER